MQKMFLLFSISLYLLMGTALGEDTSNSSKATLAAPEGLFANNEKVKKLSESIQWVLTGAGLIATVCFLIVAGKRFTEQDYVGALGPTLGAVVCGTAPFIANTIVS